MSEQHQNLIRTIESQRARIEALETALREIVAASGIGSAAMQAIARAALGAQTTPTKQD